MPANDQQVGGSHYKGKAYYQGHELQHWDLVKIFEWDYFQAQVIKYVMRYKDKNGGQDLLKAMHFLEKMLENLPIDDDRELAGGPGPGYVNQDR
jgi:hypothetical protein